MININKYDNNIIVLNLNESVTLESPFFIFEFKDIYNDSTIVTLEDLSSATSYNEFQFYESSTGTLGASGQLNVYESSVDTSILSDCSLIYNTQYKLILESRGDLTFDPSIFDEDIVYDPCSGYTYNQDINFNPVWIGQELNPLGIPASVINQDSTHRFVYDTSITIWNDKVDRQGDSMYGTLDMSVNMISNIHALNIYPTPTVGNTQYRLQWNEDEDTLDIGQQNGVVLQAGSELNPLVKNQSGVDLANGTPVMFAGAVGASGRVKIMPAIADGNYLPAYTVGLTTESIANGDDGHVAWFGKVRGLDTTGSLYGEVWEEGDIIYVSPFTAGYLTNIIPNAPHEIITIGVVVNKHAINGTIFVRPTWRESLTTLSDVNGTPLTETGQILVYDNSNGYFDFSDNINNYLLNTTDTFNGVLSIDGSLNMLDHRITNLAMAQDPSDAVNTSYLESQKVFGQLYVYDASVDVIINSGSSYTKLINWDQIDTQDNPSRNVTIDPSEGTIHIEKSGIYEINGSFSLSLDTPNTNIYGALFIDEDEIDFIHFKRRINSVNDTGSTSINGLISIDSSSYISLRFRHDFGSDVTLTLDYGNLIINKIANI